MSFVHLFLAESSRALCWVSYPFACTTRAVGWVGRTEHLCPCCCHSSPGCNTLLPAPGTGGTKLQQMKVTGRHEGHFCHQTDICLQQDRVREPPPAGAALKRLTSKRGWKTSPDVNLHSLLASLEGNSATGAGPGESGSFFSPLIIPPREGSLGAGTGLCEVVGEPEQGRFPGKSGALVTLEGPAVSEPCRGWSDVGFTPV